MYCLKAVIVTESARSRLLDSVEGARFVSLGQNLSLMPVTETRFDTGLLAKCSEHGAVAYVEAEYFGGVGTQAAQVWESGETVLGPLHLAEDEPTPAYGSPISRALRRLSVRKGAHFDEFDAVGLGRHRGTGDWLSA
ncbi:hypothetical protein [Amycolatopsis decaplanina]|uniref:Uncharacterized protein n=1 Tax=Amycolatopsis decaplanina DSM 44594 TaxID=1284240 RepID=M2Z4Z6_9PSEU|nr:hypothetical protein [Amycolatopsis decaplanina]EME55694.1 hypothetical protein H074_25220 [Amycolatopsis decaplanina DSM 44594]